MVECQLPKLDVAGSSPDSRSLIENIFHKPTPYLRTQPLLVIHTSVPALERYRDRIIRSVVGVTVMR